MPCLYKEKLGALQRVSLPSVLIVGAGQLGSRYLQGLGELKNSLRITVIDPSETSLFVARQRLAQSAVDTPMQVQFATTLSSAPQEIDLVIVATPAHCRALVVTELASCCQVGSWILEKILAQSCDQLNQIEAALAGNRQAWVNTPRRLMAWHQAIRRQLLPADPCSLKVKVSGASWGLACNAIHFIDLVSWWTSSDVESICVEDSQGWVTSKRPGFYEFIGRLLVNYCDGSLLELTCLPSLGKNIINVQTPQGLVSIDESSGIAMGASRQPLIGVIDLQSSLTSALVSQILFEGHCGLPTLTHSLAQHRPLLQALLLHWNNTQQRHDLHVPIT